jgi:broad specificity phosphatase PhoE
MRIFIIRHADPDYENNTITPAGHLEAQALAKRLTKLGLDRIYSSPLGRAMDTMKYTADALNIEPVVQPWTAELNWAGTASQFGPGAAWDVHGHIIRGLTPEWRRDDWHQYTPFDHPDFRAGVDAVHENSDIFLSGLGYHREGETYQIRRPNREKVAIFCHAAFGMTWISHLLNIPVPLVWMGFFLPPSSVTTILFDERNTQVAVPRCLGMGDISHLYAEDLPMQPSGIKANFE